MRTLGTVFTVASLLALPACALLGKKGAPQTESTSSASTADTAAPAEAAPAPAPAPAAPNLEMRKSAQCLDFKPAELTLGTNGQYQVTEGVSKKDYSGFVKRKPGQFTDGCFFALEEPGQCATMLVDRKKYAAIGNSNDWQLQCVFADKPEDGMITNDDIVPYTVTYLTNKDMILKCGHDQGSDYECHDGNNSARGGEYQKRLDAKNQDLLAVCGFGANSYDDAALKNRYVYCSYYNKQTKKVLFAFDYLRAEIKK